MQKSRLLMVLVAVLLLGAAPVLAGSNGQFKAHLSGDDANHPETRAQGQANFKLNDDGTALDYKLIIANIDNITQAHIHLGAPGVNGPIIAWLYPGGPPALPIPGRFNGVLMQGTITNANVVDPTPTDGVSFTFADLLAEIEAGNTYVNVHTSDGQDPPNTGPGDFPGGEIRGQIE